VKKANTTNPELVELIRFLRKQGKENSAQIWRKIAESLAKPRRKRIAVNLSRLARYSQKGETLAVPGKVLGTGEMNHPVTVAAFAFSAKAKEKISTANGKCLTFTELAKKNPTGSKVKVIG
jgi:large subunit ribosomal protein L18e